MYKDGLRPIALSQEYLSWSYLKGQIKPYQKVILEQTDGNDPRCNGEFQVVDALNKRYRNRGDLFFMSRKDNISCTANIYLK